MKLLTYRYKKHMTLHLGVLAKDENHVMNVAKILGDGYPKFNMVDFLNVNYEELLPLLQKAIEEDLEDNKISLDRVDILSPIQRPIHDVICVGENYTADNVVLDEEFLKNRKAIYFGKRSSYILGNEEIIKSRFDLDEKLDYEVELGIIIGKKGYKVSREEAKDMIFGFTIINDLSVRDMQVQHNQWYRGKSLDGMITMGPYVVTKDEFKFPVELNLMTYVDGELRQNSNTKYMISKIEDIICELSDGITLEPGDIIATGTPTGVGASYNPPKFLKKNQKVVCEVEKIGKLTNIVE